MFCTVFLCSTTAACTSRGALPSGLSSDTLSESSVSEQAAQEETGIPEFEKVIADIDLITQRELVILQPQKDIGIEAENYYITGFSNPDNPLLMNGETVESRGEFGSFGVFVELADGKNTFEFSQGRDVKTITITRQAEEIGLTDRITRPFPEADDVVRSGEAYTLRCVAPSGAEVSAQIQGKTISLEQRAATAVEGVPATFIAEFAPADVTGTENIGTVTYALNWQGQENTYTSPGSLFVTGGGSPLLVRVKDVSATVFTEEDTESDYYSTVKRGAVDIVTETGTNMYKLAMGGWVVKSSLEPLTTAVETGNKVTTVEYTAENKTETLLLKGSAAAPYRVEMQDCQLVFTLYRTSGIGEISVKESRLFESVQVSPDEENSIISFQLDAANPLWGYLVEYKENDILIAFKQKPKPAEDTKPLQGVTVMLDPGHGGNDIGTPGLIGEMYEKQVDQPNLPGLVEKDITLATAKAVRNYLEALGATVRMTRTSDETVSMNDRLEQIQQADVDFMISLHCNSIPSGKDGTKPSGTEVYYYEDAAATLAKSVLNGICERTGRDVRATIQGNYKITLNSNAPSIMVEMGFMTNPQEYDSLRDKQAIYDTAAAIADGIIAAI